MYDILAIVVNYNSMHIINIVKKLLRGLDRLNDLLSLKLVFVDNNSTDRSFEELSKYIIEHCNIDTVILRLSRNYGFTRAVNMAYRYAVKRWRFRYLALLNNDLVIVPENIAKIPKYLEYDNIAGVQGTIMQMQNPHLIDNAGFLIDQNGLTYPVCRGYTIDCAKLYTPSFLSGACSFYCINAINKIGTPFDDSVESYYDDKYLGLTLWSLGYRLLHIPLVTSYHLGTASYSGCDSIIKGPRWFKGIVLADLIPCMLSKSLCLPILLYYALIASGATLLTLKNYIKAFKYSIAESKLFLTKLKRQRLKFDLCKVPITRQLFFLRFHTVGIKTPYIIMPSHTCT